MNTARRDSNPQPAVLETAALPIELLPLIRSLMHVRVICARNRQGYNYVDDFRNTRPAPTVLPPSRMAKRIVFSIATGVISSTSIADVIAGHDHLDAFRQLDRAGHVRGAEIELRAVVGEERRVPAAFVLRENVDLRLELLVRLDRARLGDDHGRARRRPSSCRGAAADVVAGARFIEELAEHFDVGDGRLRGRRECRRARLPPSS